MWMNEYNWKNENDDEIGILASIQEITNNSTGTTFMIAIASHLILNSIKFLSRKKLLYFF